MIDLENVSKIYEGAAEPAVDRLNLAVEEGELIALLGESGCGKTTTLKMINRLIEPTQGTIRIAGQDIMELDPVELRRGIGYVFQGVGLFPHLTVAENIGLVPDLLAWSTNEKQERTDELLGLIGLNPAEYAVRYPSDLSGGQRQRVGVARALAGRPKTMLMDEPFGALDPITRADLRDEFKAIHTQLGLTTVMVTHDMIEALMMADRIGVMSGGEIVQLGTPHEMLTRPEHPYVEELMQTPLEERTRLDALLKGGGAT